jgi:hypothetical protein
VLVGGVVVHDQVQLDRLPGLGVEDVPVGPFDLFEEGQELLVAIEAYPLDNGDTKVDLTMAYAGIRKNFERAGFTRAADTTSVLAGHPRVLMRLELR